MRFIKPALLVLAMSVAFAGAADAATIYDANVTPDVIFGSGNTNGGFTVDQANGIELGLRGKLRHNAAGSPENTFNSNGDGTYSFNPGVAPTQAFPTAEWSFEWSINTDYLGTSGTFLDELTYDLSMTSTTGAAIASFDPINLPFADHGIGTNGTANGAGDDDVGRDATSYGLLIAGNNVAQNSWKPSWFATSFDPTVTGTYTFTLSAIGDSGTLASTSIDILVGVSAVPLPGAAWMGFALLGGLAMTRRMRRKK